MATASGEMHDLPSRTAPAGRLRDATGWQFGAAQTPISHAHARLLAWFWEAPDRPDDSVTVLARTGAIRHDAERQLARDLELLTQAADQSSDPGATICQMQIDSLLQYVQRHGQRAPVEGWTDFADDGEFGARTREFVRARRRVLDETPRTRRPGRSGGRPPERADRRSDRSADSAPTAAAHDRRGASRPEDADDSTTAEKTIYEQLGGASAVRAAVDVFYGKVLADQRIAHHFKGVSMMRLKAHQRAFLAAVTGGDQDVYADMDTAMDRLRTAHERLKISRHDFNLVVTHLVTTLTELGVATELVEELTPTILQLREAIVSVDDVQPFREGRNKEDDVAEKDDQSIYERMGGANAVHAAVDLFYRKIIADDRINDYFTGVNVGRLKAHQRAMIAAVAGGPNAYQGRSMREAHSGHRITDEAFDIVAGHLVATLEELGVGQGDIDRLTPPVLDLRGDIVTA